MAFELMSFSSGAGLIKKQAVSEIVKCNDYTRQFGLTLTQTEATELTETRFEALSANGRIEFGGGAVNKIIRAFCDSPYLNSYNYAATLHDLTELFYYYKNETLELLSDDELIDFMKTAFDGICGGSVELLGSRELDQMAQNIRFGRAAYYSEPPIEEDTEDEDEE